jgi:hypothetical protein
VQSLVVIVPLTEPEAILKVGGAPPPMVQSLIVPLMEITSLTPASHALRLSAGLNFPTP